MSKKLLISYFSLIILISALFLAIKPIFAQQDLANPSTTLDSNSSNKQGDSAGNGNNQIISSHDAIGLRIVPNPEHFSPEKWYENNIKVKGSPSSAIVDGYNAVRDGRTVYVSAAKISGTNLYTNIYIISYNQSPEEATTDIFGQLLQYWKFNIEIKNCSKTTSMACVDNSDCPKEEICQPLGNCSVDTEKACVIDQDCLQSGYCNSKKATIIRDTKRLADLKDVGDILENYNSKTYRYPTLATGTYLTNRTISAWPSWDSALNSSVGTQLPVDPINKLGRCKKDDNDNTRFNPLTCWDETAKEFSGVADPLAMPAGSNVYYYQASPTGHSYRFCTLVESGYIETAPGSVYCQTGQNCNPNCSGKVCGDDGCGGSCGTCSINKTCRNGQCVISPIR